MINHSNPYILPPYIYIVHNLLQFANTRRVSTWSPSFEIISLKSAHGWLIPLENKIRFLLAGLRRENFFINVVSVIIILLRAVLRFIKLYDNV